MIIIGSVGWIALRHSHEGMGKSLAQAGTLTGMIDTSRHAQVQFKVQIQEWKNILLRGNDEAQFKKYQDAFVAEGKVAQQSLAKLQEQAVAGGFDPKAIVAAQKSLTDLQAKYLEALRQFDPAKPDSAQVVDKLVKGMDREPTKQLDDIVQSVADHARAASAAQMADDDANYSRASTILVIVAVAALVIGGLLTRFMVFGITHPLGHAVRFAQEVASGDLSRKIIPRGKDETAELMRALSDMTQSLHKIIGEIKTASTTIVSEATQIADGNLDLSSRTEQQASALEETASSMEELISTVRNNAEHAMSANNLASEASDVARRGGEVVGDVVLTMDSINESSRKVVDIISVIDGIAFQTNILALNAAVEAARAGEQGRGFAVVAAEVRNLAQRSAGAAKEIKALISDSVDKVDAGTKLVSNAGATMQEVVNSVQQVRDLIGDIANASQEQASGIEQVNQAVSQMEQATQQNAALVEEAAATAQALREQAGKLADMAQTFRT
ncbi:HAMP domain-containing protein [Noviherbaspirillum sp. 17J57-3]|uniref:HAMP domain-containing protein n=2 Tax=Noviherbaspirillum galbum TaxID=2709383 RepID=A0A6B3SK00_9BURK|nr:HAMP domain-containing protein [Noviherbaspirillum galbum]